MKLIKSLPQDKNTKKPTKTMIDKNHFDNIEKYYFTPELIDAVRVAEFLGKPLLLTGEPGTGKTKLAEALVQVFGKAWKTKVVKRTFNTKSVSIYKDLLYTYEQLKHFQDVQLNVPKRKEKAFETEYISYGALGEAIKDKVTRSVVLIDEVDKAPRDFPNDLLDVLDQTTFEVPELKKELSNAWQFEADEKNKPFIIITSNSEKSLPDAFLRRCVYHHIAVPKDDKLQQVLLMHFAKNEIKPHFEKIDAFFEKVRKELYRKAPGTAELIAWLQVMQNQKFPFDKLEWGNVDNLNESERQILRLSFSILAKKQDDFELIHKAHQ
jgi:MoxR-like ATPase